MKYQTIVLTKEAGVATITLNRPEVRNAFNMRMTNELVDALHKVAEDDKARVLVLTGTGKAFCSGADFRYHEQRTGKLRPEMAEEIRPVLDGLKRGRFLHGVTEIILAIHHMEKPTIAMVNGDAVGAGFDFALACDIRYASPSARFVVGFTRIGLPPDTGTAWFLPRLMGVNKALEMIYSGEFASAEQAERLGIVNRVIAASKLEAETLAFARKLAQGAPIAQRLSKHLVYEGLQVGLDSALIQAMSAIAIGIQTADHAEGVAAMAAKRPPVYKDR
ncbi:MAG: enoyl-CoA hydratase/isomerase family protein [Chloroflexi bacterium]|nr:enoyl-CoA hydratase/isomerase family protein [Chloroflexota bacterium]